MELGAGTGVAGLACAALGARSVLLTDRPEILPLLDRNRRRNAWVQTLKGSEVAVAPLVWTSKSAVFGVLSELGGRRPDCVVATDVVYSQDHVAPLADTILNLIGTEEADLSLCCGRREEEADLSPLCCGLLACEKKHDPIAYAALLKRLQQRGLRIEHYFLSDDRRFEIVLLFRQ